MSGNSRGKLKEHFRGIHSNLDWCVHHVNLSLALITTQLSYTEDYVNAKGDKDKQQAVLDNNNMYKAALGLGEAIKILDGIAQSIYTEI